MFGDQSASGAGTSGFLVDELRVVQALRDFSWMK
jgi:hypothetical protein